MYTIRRARVECQPVEADARAVEYKHMYTDKYEYTYERRPVEAGARTVAIEYTYKYKQMYN